MKLLHELPFDSWTPPVSEAERASLEAALENGGIVFLPHLAFRPRDPDLRFLSPRWLNPASKNIHMRAEESTPRGALGSREDRLALGRLLARFGVRAEALIRALLPRYAPLLQRGETSFRPCRIEGRALSWRKDDTRLHVDAFPSNPSRGMRILRVFSNANLDGNARIWRVGEAFHEVAGRYLRRIPRPLPGWAWVLEKLRITKQRRSEYDHFMLHLHDLLKADLEYQKTGPRKEIAFPAGSTWIAYTDQVVHAAVSGQHAFEQTFHLPADVIGQPHTSPVRVLERLTGRALA